MPWTSDLRSDALGRTESIFFSLLQPAASFHSVQLMSDTKTDVSCEIPVW